MTEVLNLKQGGLTWNGYSLLTGLPDAVSAEEDPAGVGVFLRFTAPAPAARHVFPVGRAVGMVRFTCCHRYEPFWMNPCAGTRAGEVPAETQFLLTEQEDGSCALYVPLIEGAFRASLQGDGEDGLERVAESGDPATVTDQIVGLFVAAGPDPVQM